jgi:hypothetical protein
MRRILAGEACCSSDAGKASTHTHSRNHAIVERAMGDHRVANAVQDVVLNRDFPVGGGRTENLTAGTLRNSEPRRGASR